jgi:hypothetical protein
VQKGVDLSQRVFGNLLGEFVQAVQDAVTTVDDRKESENLVNTQKLPCGLDHPHLPLCNLLTF